MGNAMNYVLPKDSLERFLRQKMEYMNKIKRYPHCLWSLDAEKSMGIGKGLSTKKWRGHDQKLTVE
jgi:hypothetical protein